MTSSELSEWMAYENFDPVGEVRGDIRMASLSALIANAFKAGFGKKSAKTSKPIDFMPKWDDQEDVTEKPAQSVDEMKSQINTIAKIFGVDKNKKRDDKRKKKGE